MEVIVKRTEESKCLAFVFPEAYKFYIMSYLVLSNLVSSVGLK